MSALATTTSSLISSSLSSNPTDLATAIPGAENLEPWRVICAWPVSGQYGPGSRVLYYVLVAACVLARKVDWLRNGFLAAALIFPAVAALHGIVLASIHLDGAVDMDIYGAFQLCAIGILAAPITVRISKTYFYDPGRNTIFMWTAMITAGLLSLTVEFYRATPTNCFFDDAGNRISPRDGNPFPYEKASCNLTCSTEDGPFSPMRKEAANNIYVIPAPTRLSFGTGTLLAAACCIPAILLMASMWIKILEINWKSRFGTQDEEWRNEPLSGTNGATEGRMIRINSVVKQFLSVLGIPIFTGAILTILIVGEINFFSEQVKYMTEPIESVGQWANLVGAGLATFGSIYLLIATDVERVKDEENGNGTIQHCNCSHHHLTHRGGSVSPIPAVLHHTPTSRDSRSIHGDFCESPMQSPMGSPAMQETGKPLFSASTHSVAGPSSPEIGRELSSNITAVSNDLAPTTTQSSHGALLSKADTGGRRKVAKTVAKIGNFLGTAARDQFDDSEFKSGKAMDFPEIPGEIHRNRDLRQIREQYNQRPSIDRDGMPSSQTRSRSRAGSFNSIRSERSVSRAPSPSPSAAGKQPATMDHGLSEAEDDPPSPLVDRKPKRRDTLDVPRPHQIPSRHNSAPAQYLPDVTVPQNPGSPLIVVSSDPEPSTTADEKAS